METKQNSLETPGINKEPFTLIFEEKWYNGYKTLQEIYRGKIIKYMKENPGMMGQLEWCKAHPGEIPVLTEEMIDEFIETLRYGK